jgi:hypothetical protein
MIGPQLPKKGDRFIHRHSLRDGVRAQDVRNDPENEANYQVCVVTRVKRYRGSGFSVGYTYDYAWDQGIRSAVFATERIGENSRRWL